MAETIAALFLAHVLADYVLQTRWMVDTKRGAGFAAHATVVFGAAVLCLGQLSLAVMGITFVHLLIDATKTLLLPDRLWSYLADQGLHIASILAIAALFPAAWEHGVWADPAPEGTTAAMAVVAGLIFALRGGHFAIFPYIDSPPPEMARRMALTGGLERAAVFAAVMGGVAAAALLVPAARAAIWWRRGGLTVPGRRRAVTAMLTGFAWALATAFATRALIAML